MPSATLTIFIASLIGHRIQRLQLSFLLGKFVCTSGSSVGDVHETLELCFEELELVGLPLIPGDPAPKYCFECGPRSQRELAIRLMLETDEYEPQFLYTVLNGFS